MRCLSIARSGDVVTIREIYKMTLLSCEHSSNSIGVHLFNPQLACSNCHIYIFIPQSNIFLPSIWSWQPPQYLHCSNGSLLGRTRQSVFHRAVFHAQSLNPQGQVTQALDLGLSLTITIVAHSIWTALKQGPPVTTPAGLSTASNKTPGSKSSAAIMLTTANSPAVMHRTACAPTTHLSARSSPILKAAWLNLLATSGRWLTPNKTIMGRQIAVQTLFAVSQSVTMPVSSSITLVTLTRADVRSRWWQSVFWFR